ncbi:transcriptional adapter 3 [Scaptodrosophila lebanonensis]|uniref:Transcriptional adapter 3 n=1 Tax=Drosophila lebanonensis TaxID=7225 RepID=A0A6J2TSC4_DROLE|nr:transcriptional adapter 3 [Scaptodrosophila lebanonensis]
MSANPKSVKLGHVGGGFGISMSAVGGGSGKLSASNNSGTGGSKSTSASGPGGAHAHAGDTDVFMTSSGVVIPLIRTKDVPKQLPTIAAALQRPSDDHLAAEELDAVQLELELMLSNVALRARVLKAEYDNMDKDEKRNDRRKFERMPGSPPATMLNGLLGITGSNSVGSPASGASKRKRDEPTGVRKKHSSMTILKQQTGASSSSSSKHAKNSPMAVHTDDSMDCMPNAMPGATALPSLGNNGQRSDHQQSQQMPKMAVPKNDMPNKFWLSVEPYCMPLTNEDFRLIDDLLEQYRGPLVPPIPTLGPHYSTVWAQEDMKCLQPGGARMKSQNSLAMLKKAEGLVEENITGPLTQRLVSALIEESLLTLPSEQAAVGEHSNSNSTTTSSNENTHTSSTNSASAAGNFRSLSMLKHCVGIEQRVKKELVESGIFEAGEFAHDDVDEVLMEIKRITAEISTVAHFNSEELKRLRAAASEEIKRIELKRKLDTVDQEILECYKRMLQYRAKRKGHTLEEKQEIMRLTNEQRTLAEQLDRIYMFMPGSGGDQKL